MEQEKLYTARQAAQLLGYRDASTAQRKAKIAFEKGKHQVQRIGKAYAAPLPTWMSLLSTRGTWRGKCRKSSCIQEQNLSK